MFAFLEVEEVGECSFVLEIGYYCLCLGFQVVEEENARGLVGFYQERCGGDFDDVVEVCELCVGVALEESVEVGVPELAVGGEEEEHLGEGDGENSFEGLGGGE